MSDNVMTYEYVRKTLDENGRKLLDMLDAWKADRGDIEFVDNNVGFNICLKTDSGPVTIFVFWGELNQKESFVMESRQHEYPPFVKVDRADRIRIARLLQGNYFQETSGPHMNSRLEFRQLPMTPERLVMIVSAINGSVNILKEKI